MEVLARIRNYDELRAALAERKINMGLRNLDLDEIAGLQGGYTGKILCGMKRPGDMSLPALLGALQCELVLIRASSTYRAERLEEYEKGVDASKIIMKKRQVRGGIKRALRMTPEERRRSAKKAIAARWKKHRMRKARERAEGHEAVIAPTLKEPARRGK